MIIAVISMAALLCSIISVIWLRVSLKRALYYHKDDENIKSATEISMFALISMIVFLVLGCIAIFGRAMS